MPVGTQETITGLVCYFCHELIDESSATENVCADCENNFLVECESCLEEGFNVDLMNFSAIQSARSLGIQLMSVHTTDDNFDIFCGDCCWQCESCGSTFSYEENMLDCCAPQGSRHIRNYSYRPSPLYFYQVTDGGTVSTSSYETNSILFMGIELETAKMSRHVDDMFDEMTFLQKDFVYFKEDASIGSDGVEIVTHPATLDAFTKVFPFDALDNARFGGARSYAYESCGFHIHVNRGAFSPTHMWKFVRFQLNNHELCKRVAQRDESHFATWYWDRSEQTAIPDFVKGKQSNGRRYLAINFQNRHTVELRYFKGNILRGAILKNLEFVDAMYRFTKELSVRDVAQGAIKNEEKFYEFLDQNRDRYSNLVYFLDNNATNMESN